MSSPLLTLYVADAFKFVSRKSDFGVNAMIEQSDYYVNWKIYMEWYEIKLIYI